jgi:hypothetical protein
LFRTYPLITPDWHANCLTSYVDERPEKIRTSEGNQMKAEQRQHPRYGIRDAEFHVFSHGIQITGRLVNISKGGLSFEFAPGPKKTIECRAIDILGPDPDRFYLSGIACRLVYDIGHLAEGRSFTGVATRLRGVQYTDLTDAQTQELTDIIDRYGIKIRTIP